MGRERAKLWGGAIKFGKVEAAEFGRERKMEESESLEDASLLSFSLGDWIKWIFFRIVSEDVLAYAIGTPVFSPLFSLAFF